MMRTALLVLIAACSSLDDIDPDVCGNGVLESGEDCDSNDPRCVQCGIRCEFALAGAADEQCSSFPGAAGFVCGADDFCHAPSGLFRPPTELSTAIDTFRASDIDSDGFGDLVVQSATSIRLLFGNADGHPTTSTQVLTPIARGAAHYADLDLDAANKLDVLLPAADGIVAYTSPYDVLSPYPFPSIVSAASEGRPFYSTQLSDQVIAFVGTGPNAPAGAPVFLLVRDVGPTGQNTFIGMGPVCGATDLTFDPHAVDLYRVSADYHVLATTFRQGAQLKLCVLGVENSGGTYSVTELPVNLGVGRAAASRPVLAPIGGGSCPSVVVREQLGAQLGDVVAVAGSGTLTCSYDGVPSIRSLATDKGNPVGWAPLVPPDQSGATVALALGTGVFAVPPTGPLVRQLYLADRILSSIVHADIDDDGDTDIIASSAQAGELVEDIDVLTRVGPGYVRLRFDTDGPVDLLTIGDYDGNGISDVAYVQTRVIGGVERYELVIAYATGDQLLPGIGAGTYGKIISLIPGDIPDSNDPFAIISDLVVLFEDFDQSAITILHGSPQRTMLGFFDPRVSPIPSTFRGIVAGNFNDAAGPAGLDMIAIEDGDAGVPRVWRSSGPTGNQVEMPPPNAVSLLSDCERAAASTDLCIGGALYVRWPKDETHDRVIAFGQDGNGDARVITFDPHTTETAFPAAAWPAIPELPQKARIRTAEVVELGASRMLVLSIIAQLEVRLLLCAVGTDGIATACHDIGARISTPENEFVCTHAAAARVRPVQRFMENAPVDRDLIALCHDKGNADATRVFQILVENGEPTQHVPLLRIGRAREVRIGDIDGNGLDDLLTVDRESTVPTLRISLQCTSREVTTCAF